MGRQRNFHPTAVPKNDPGGAASGRIGNRSYRGISDQAAEGLFVDQANLLNILLRKDGPERRGSFDVEKFLRRDQHEAAVRLEGPESLFEEEKIKVEASSRRLKKLR